MEYEAEYKEPFNKRSKYKEVNLPKIKFPRVGLIVAYVIFLLTYIYIVNPVLNPIYESSYVFIIINIFIIVFLIFKNKLDNKIVRSVFTILLVGSILIYTGLSLASSPIFNSKAYYSLVGDVKTYNYEDVKSELKTDKIPVVDYELAKRLGDKVLGEDIGLGSQFDIGEYYLISTTDDLAWVAPLEPQNIFKWLQNKEGAPGYIYVSATNPNDVRLVKDINGQEIKLKYTDKSYFNRDIKRYAYLNGNLTRGLIDYSFEIDDSGNPYWIITTYKPTIGFSGNDVSGIVTVDAQTGEIKRYALEDEDIPSWIDRIYPKEMVRNQLSYYGAYKNGWLNTVTSQKEMVQPTEGISYMFIDGKPYFYTGMTSIKSDEATVGFMLHSTTDKQTSFFKVNGATETAAKKSAEGKVQQYNYIASSPILLDIYQKPTYFMTLKDGDGLVKQYAFVSVENYNIVGIGGNVEEAKLDYYNQLKDNNILVKSDGIEKSKTGKINRINYLNDYYYFTLEEDSNIYMVDQKVSNKLILTQPGDSVSITYVDEKTNSYVEAITFENTSF